MKRILYGISITLIVCLVVLGLVVFRKQSVNPIQQNSVTELIPVPVVTLSLFDGITTATYAGIQAQSPFEALTKTAAQQGIPIQTKQYDFGVFVEAIGGKKNTKDKAWIYVVNGISGEVASDKYTLKQNDVVEWKYTTPMY